MVVVLGDADCAVMRAGAALRAAAASTAAAAGRMEAISSGCGLGAGDCGGTVAIRRLQGPMRPAAACGRDMGLQSPLSELGWAWLLHLTRACASVPTGGGTVHAGCIWVRGGGGLKVTGLCAVGVCRPLGRAGVSRGVRLCVAGVWGLPGVGGGGSRVLRLSVARVCSLFGWRGGPLRGAQGWEGRGRGCGAGFACGALVLVFARGGVHVWSPVGLEVWRWSFPSTAAAARILQMLVRNWCVSWSVVCRGYRRGGFRSTRQRILWRRGNCR